MKTITNKFRQICLALTFLAVLACQPEGPDPKPQEQTEWISRADDFQKTYTLDQMVILNGIKAVNAYCNSLIEASGPEDIIEVRDNH